MASILDYFRPIQQKSRKTKTPVTKTRDSIENEIEFASLAHYSAAAQLENTIQALLDARLKLSLTSSK